MGTGHGLARVFWWPEGFQDAAIGNGSAPALSDQARQLAAQGCQVGNLAIHSIKVLPRKCVHLATWTVTVISETEKGADLVETKAKIACTPNEAQSRYLRFAVATVVRGRARCLREEADLFVISDRFNRRSGRLSQLADRHAEHLLTL